jgi:uncharacterized LabA/DUF88 family protein
MTAAAAAAAAESAWMPVPARAAVFVDAGWVMATAAIELTGSRGRDEIRADYGGFLDLLDRVITGHGQGQSVLRTYWYDAAPDARPTYEHHRIASHPFVKVRLGKLTAGRAQKGVDVLIYSDLMALARERAMTRAYLVAGDEDLREAVSDVQRLGVQVVLLQLPPSGAPNQSPDLVRECDALVQLRREQWLAHFRKREASEPTDAAAEDVIAVRRIGADFARDWHARSSREQVEETMRAFPRLQRDLDIDLLVAAEDRMGSLRGRHDLKSELRGSFWSGLKRAVDEGRSS